MMTNRYPRARLTKQHLSACIAALVALGATASAEAVEQTDLPLLARFAANLKSRPLSREVAAVDSVMAGDTIVVSTCADDGGFDTLRHAALVANSGDTIDLSKLPCSTITLEAGAIGIGLADLTIVGPGAGKLTIDGNLSGRVFTHTGTGTLTVRDVTIAHGLLEANNAYGGCILSKGNVTVDHAVVNSCTALGQAKSVGGGIVAYGSLIVQSSTLSGNSSTTQVGDPLSLAAAGGAAFASVSAEITESTISGNVAETPNGKSYGGGVTTIALTLKYSTVTNNEATAAGNVTDFSSGGGVVSSSDTTIFASTIDHNAADAAGGVALLDGADVTASIAQSTISSNVGRLGIGAVSVACSIAMRNNTIAFNTSGATVPANVLFSGISTDLQNTIIADNAPMDAAGGGAITGSHNLIKSTDAGTTLPAGTITLDPKLGPLVYNGGPTRTHALGAGSPALNAGINPIGYGYDQRGPTHNRVVDGVADIGAYEVDTDHVFGDSLEHPYAF